MTPQALESDVRRLATADGRCVGTLAHDAARRYLLERLSGLGLEPYQPAGFALPYRSAGQGFTNLVGRIPGTRPDLAPVLLGAHYDTAGVQPGADDNAAAVAIVLEVGEALIRRGLERPVLVALFDAEEPPYFLSSAMGSTVFYTQQRAEDIHCAVILDLVGHDVPVPGLEDLLFITGMESDEGLARVLESCPYPAALRVIAALNRYVGDMSDHHVFRVHERPYLFMSCGRWPHYHVPSDTPEKLNYAKMAALCAYLAALVPQISDTPLTGPFEGYDSTPAELGMMRPALGPFVAAYGLTLESRRDIDQVASLFLSRLRL